MVLSPMDIFINGNIVRRDANGLSSVRIRMIEPDNLILQDVEDVDDFPEDIFTAVERLIVLAQRSLGLNFNDSMGFVFNTHDAVGAPFSIAIPLRTISTITAENILDIIAMVVQSNNSIDLTMDVVVTGRRGVQANRREAHPDQWVVAGTPSNMIMERFIAKKRCLIGINPLGDKDRLTKDCLYQFFLLGLAFLDRNHELDFESKSKLNELVSQQNCTSLYLRLTSGCKETKFKLRHYLASKLQMQLMFEEETQMDQIIRMENYFNVNVVLYDVALRFCVMYPMLHDVQRPNKPTIFGIVERGDLGHVTFCSSPHALPDTNETTRVCTSCYNIYSRSRVCGGQLCSTEKYVNCVKCHVCPGSCSACRSMDCGMMLVLDEEDEDYEELKPFSRDDVERKCPFCKVFCHSIACRHLHDSICADLKSVRCEVCGRANHRGLACDEIRCFQCSAKVNNVNIDSHICYLQRGKLKKPLTNYWSYDFEACLDENKNHVIYLATACPIYPIEFHPLMSKYEFRKLQDGRPIFIFWGLLGVKKFFEFLCEPFVYKTDFYAHNAGRYDSIFVEKYMLEMNGALPCKLQRGNRIMQMTFLENEITFKDSLCFISTALRNIPDNFGIAELRKGFFPHKVMTVEYLNQAEALDYQVVKPPRDVWQSDFNVGRSGMQEKKELEKFLTEEFYINPEEKWDLKEECITYCISDTALLAEGLKMFRENCMQLAREIVWEGTGTRPEFDVLQYVTLPSAVFALYMALSLPVDTIPIVDRYIPLCKIEECTWVIYEASKLGIPLNSITWNTPLFHFKLAASTETILFLFMHCYDNGCPQCYPQVQRNYRLQRPFDICFQEGKNRINLVNQFAKTHNKQVKRIWTHDWNGIKKDRGYRKWRDIVDDQITDWIPMDPRSCYKGGVSEMYKIFYPGKISMSDFVSQYPTPMLGFSYCPYTNERISWEMPTGPYEVKTHVHPDEVIGCEQLGLVKCRVLAPNQLRAPFLGFKAHSRLCPNSYEVIYGLCRICMEGRLDKNCMHSADERSFTGSWCISELKYALTLGYTIIYVTELWTFQGQSDSLFKNFITPFIRAKIISKRSGLVDVNNQFTADGLQVSEYLQVMTGKEVSPDEFKDVPVIRNISKLMINSFYGKFGQRPIWPSTSAFTESDEDIKACESILRDSSIEVNSFELIPRTLPDGTDEVIAIIAYEKAYPTSKGDSKKSDLIAAHVTCAGRIMLNRLSNKLGSDLIYVDTDSAFHVKKELPYSPGFRIGDLELELPEADAWVAHGRKGYMYQKDGQVICKQKGISLKSSMSEIFSFEKLYEMIQGTRQFVARLELEGFTYEEALEILKKSRDVRPSLDVMQTNFITERNALCGSKITRTSMKKTCFLLESMKRRIVPLHDEIDTLPFGHVE